MVFAFDLNLMNPDEPFADTALKRSHIGVKYKFESFVVRACINSGYLALG
ncbi:hypothetical protein AGMMS49573_04490 [Endomicrobiia bacterium]|nr:hypothetical protein AGMMS49532_08540 [Endomicrobiia bacterium]GHT16067.1 hypothetical protein AGMMS49573_04490 [Endomicrobiia bacterium]GMO55505.1 MAG: hypothetical protein Ta2C_10410 [Candidatus Endomicrobium trichonymphae]